MPSAHFEFASPNRSRSGSFGSSEEAVENRKFSIQLYFYNICTAVLTSKYYTGFMTALTIFVLFADDVRLAYFASYSDNLFLQHFLFIYIISL